MIEWFSECSSPLTAAPAMSTPASRNPPKTPAISRAPAAEARAPQPVAADGWVSQWHSGKGPPDPHGPTPDVLPGVPPTPPPTAPRPPGVSTKVMVDDELPPAPPAADEEYPPAPDSVARDEHAPEAVVTLEEAGDFIFMPLPLSRCRNSMTPDPPLPLPPTPCPPPCMAPPKPAATLL